MHEISLMRGLIRQVEAIAAEQGGGVVTRVDVSVGPLSGVEPLLLQSAFEQLASRSTISQAELSVQCIGLAAACRVCGQAFEVESFRFECPSCQSRSVQITSGDDFRLLSLEIEDELPSRVQEVLAR